MVSPNAEIKWNETYRKLNKTAEKMKDWKRYTYVL